MVNQLPHPAFLVHALNVCPSMYHSHLAGETATCLDNRLSNQTTEQIETCIQCPTDIKIGKFSAERMIQLQMQFSIIITKLKVKGSNV